MIRQKSYTLLDLDSHQKNVVSPELCGLNCDSIKEYFINFNPKVFEDSLAEEVFYEVKDLQCDSPQPIIFEESADSNNNIITEEFQSFTNHQYADAFTIVDGEIITLPALNELVVITPNEVTEKKTRRGRPPKNWDEIEKKSTYSGDVKRIKKDRNNVCSGQYRKRRSDYRIKLKEDCQKLSDRNFYLTKLTETYEIYYNEINKLLSKYKKIHN